ncbi:MAG: winged helix-turn-helix domain-containing protein [Nanoarchaeota archaeon]
MFKKRKSLDVQKKILEVIKKNPGITMSQLERKIGTNPTSLKEHCEHLEFLGLIKIKKTEKTTVLLI